MRGLPCLRAVALLVAYVAAIVWLTWPLGAKITTHLPEPTPISRCDTLNAAWSLAHQSDALATAPRRYAEGNIYHPAAHTLLYGEAAFGAVPFFMPVFLATRNPALALNVVFLGMLAVTAWAMHLVVARWTGSWLAGLVAGATLLLNRWHVWGWGAAAPNFVVLPYFPLIVFLAATPGSRAPHALALVALVVLQGLSSIYVAAAVLGPLALLALARCVRPTTRRAGIALVVVVLAAAAVLFLVYLPNALVVRSAPGWSERTFWPLGTRHPTELPWEPFSGRAATGVPLGILGLIAAGAVCRLLGRPRAERSAWVHGSLWAVAGLVLSISPVVRWDGAVVALPHAALPVYGALREVRRLGVAGLMGLSVLAGVAFAECRGRLEEVSGGRIRGLVGPLLAAAVLLVAWVGYVRGLPVRRTGSYYRPLVSDEVLPSTYPISPAIGESALTRLLAEPGGPVLELPVRFTAFGPDPVPQARAMYRSIFHRRPLLNGYHSYWPPGFRERLDLASRLPATEALAALRAETGLAAVLVHTAQLDPFKQRVWNDRVALERAGLRVVARDGGDILLSVTPP
jgi:hypothetical protein